MNVNKRNQLASLKNMGGVLENNNPEVFGTVAARNVRPEEEDDDVYDEIDAREVFDILL